MGKFNKSGKKGMPELNTSSLPDLIFTMLFFFMIVTTMREVTLKVQFQTPQATELEKLEKKSLVTFIYTEPSSRTTLMGEQPNPWDLLQPQDVMSRCCERGYGYHKQLLKVIV